MNYRPSLCAAATAAAVLWLQGCCCPTYQAPVRAVSQPMTTCTTQVLEGFVDTGDCPAFDDEWQMSQPFAHLGQQFQFPPNSDGGRAVEELSRFCRYRSSKDQAPTLAEVTGKGTFPGNLAVNKTCRVLTTQSATVSHQRHWWKELRRPGAWGADPVAVGVIDTASGQADKDDVSGHGHLVASALAYAACGDTGKDCSKKVVFESALPLRNARAIATLNHFTAGSYNSGFFGTPSMLAEALLRVLLSDEFKARGVQGRKIINLSIGWEQRFGTGLQAVKGISAQGYKDLDELQSGEAGPRAALLALKIVNAADVVVFAAAGNRAGPGTDSIAILPAGYARVGVPDRAGNNSKRRYANAVSGIDFQGRKMSIQRSAAWGELAAPGVSYSGRAGGRELLRSGTSISTAVISGFAMRALSYKPYEPEDLVSQLVSEGKSTSIKPSLCSDGTSCSPHVAFLGLPDSLPPVKLKDLATQDIDLGFCPQAPPVCGATSYRSNRCPPMGKKPDQCGAYCAHQEMIGQEALPWSGPHPTIPMCPECSLVDGDFLLETDGNYPNDGLYGKIIVKTDQATLIFDLASYGHDPLSPGISDGLSLDLEGGTAISASLTFVDDSTKGLSHLEEIPVQ